jgi:hypothetical protein
VPQQHEPELDGAAQNAGRGRKVEKGQHEQVTLANSPLAHRGGRRGPACETGVHRGGFHQGGGAAACKNSTTQLQSASGCAIINNL